VARTPFERACARRLIPPQFRRLDRELAAVVAEVSPAVGAEHLERARGERLRQAPELGVEVALWREARLAERAAPQPDLAVAVGILPLHQRDRDLGPVEQAGAHLILDDAALGEHACQVEVVDRESGIAPNGRVREAGINAVGVAGEQDVPTWSVKKNRLPSFRVIRQIAASRVVPSSRCARIAGGERLGHGVAKGWGPGSL
jgi:hypothetical protein